MYDRLKALELLGKHLGMFSEKPEISAREAVEINYSRINEEDMT